jgi:hypothetical protein
VSDDNIDLPPLGDDYPEVAQWLSKQPPVRMPDEVWNQLSAALAAEPALRPSDSSVVSLTGRRSSRAAGRRRVMPLVGAAAGLALLGAVGIPVVLGGNAANPPVAEAPMVMTTTEPSDEIPDGAPAASSLPSPRETSSDVTSPNPPPVAPTERSTSSPAYRVVATGTDYVPASMTEQVSGLLVNTGLARSPGTTMADDVLATVGTAPAGVPAMVGSAGFTSSAQALSDCVERLHLVRGHEDAAAPALVVDRALYEGQESGVVVMLAGGQPGRPYLDVAVVGPDCGPAEVAAAIWFRYDLP